MNTKKIYDIVVVGAGHAGCEAALAGARLGLKTVIFTVSVDSIALMPCNPNIGGSSKGHLVKELDALGGEMGKCIDKTFIQSKMLNASKGPAVHSLRAQADKQEYSKEMRKTLENTPNLSICQKEITKLIIEDNICKGVETISGSKYYAKAVILATGTYLNARCIYGEVAEYTGPNGLKSANHLTSSLIEYGIDLNRFKTGTPARVDGRTINYEVMEEQYGDNPVVPFSFETDPESIQKEQVKCYLAYTGEKTHEIIRENIDRSPLFSGAIKGTGPRYCPSIEDKYVRFNDKERHQLFLEPEGRNTKEIYIQGLSTSLPDDVQHDMVRSIAGLENAVIIRNGYAIEYDAVNPMTLWPTLETKLIDGLFTAGQINGTSGYEEAAGQGIMAGINAACKILGEEPMILGRDEAYIGVLIDDLVTKGTNEPYRLLTSRAEHRLLLRHDNADMRLTEKAYNYGLVTEERYRKFSEKRQAVADEIERLKTFRITPTANTLEKLVELNSAEIRDGILAIDMLRRPELSHKNVMYLADDSTILPKDIVEQVEIEVKYEGYIKKSLQQVEKLKKMNAMKIPSDLDYDEVPSLAIEAREKLKKVLPLTIGQASRISGVNPADISILLVFLEQRRGMNNE